MRPRRGAAPVAAFATLPAPCSTRLRPASVGVPRVLGVTRNARAARATRQRAPPAARLGAATLRRRRSEARRRRRRWPGVVAELLQRVDRQRQRPAAQRRASPRRTARGKARQRRRVDAGCAQRQRLQRLAAGRRRAAPSGSPMPCVRSQATASAGRQRRGAIAGSGCGSSAAGRPGAAVQSTKRSVAGGLLERLQEGIGGDRRSSRSAGWITITLPRPRADVVVRQCDGRAHLPRPGSPCSAFLPALSSPPSSPSSASHPAQAFAQRLGQQRRSRSGCERAARQPAGSRSAARPLAERRDRSLAQPALGQRQRQLELADAAGAVQQQACAAASRARCSSGACSQGSTQLAVGAGQPSCRLTQPPRAPRTADLRRTAAGASASMRTKRGGRRRQRAR